MANVEAAILSATRLVFIKMSASPELRLAEIAAVALVQFPLIGHELHLSDNAFGLREALVILTSRVTP